MTYNVFYNITMSAFVIGEMTNYKRYSTRLKARVSIVSGKFFKYENKRQTVLAKLELPHFIETAFEQACVVD